MAIYTRQTKITDLPVLAKWMLEEKWHVSENQLLACYLLDPEGWMAAETEDGEFIG